MACYWFLGIDVSKCSCSFSLVKLMYPVFVGSVMFLFLGKEDRKIDSVTVFLTLCVIFVVVNE